MVQFVDDHLLQTWKDPTAPLTPANADVVLYRGDRLNIVTDNGVFTEIDLGGGRTRWARSPISTRAAPLLALAFVDVGQGDACVVSTPDGQRLLIDGGENQRLARYLAFSNRDAVTAGELVLFDAVVVTHGDADHFAGLSTLILDAPGDPRPDRRIRFATKRVIHNGLVKRPSKLPDGNARPDGALLGNTVRLPSGDLAVVDLVDDIRRLAKGELNRPFARWQQALKELESRHALTVSRVDASMSDAFSFLGDVNMRVLGPLTVPTSDGQASLPYLAPAVGGGVSATQTINGHSVTLQVQYGKVRLLLTGDLTANVERELLARHASGELDLRSHVLKVPHHGSGDMDIQFLRAVHPLISIISSGDEDARRDYLHPRANVLGALGSSGLGSDPLIFNTNLSAFDKYVGRAFRAKKVGGEWVPDVEAGTFYARERSVHGIVHVRTDGEEILVCRKGARRGRAGIEAYAYRVKDRCSVEPIELTCG